MVDKEKSPSIPMAWWPLPRCVLAGDCKHTFLWIFRAEPIPIVLSRARGKQNGAFLDTSGVLECPCCPWDFSSSQVSPLALCYKTTKPFHEPNKDAITLQLFLERLPHARLCSRCWGSSRKNKWKQETEGYRSLQSGERQAISRPRMVSRVMEFSLTERSKIENSFCCGNLPDERGVNANRH